MNISIKKRVLVTVKAYPNPSKKYIETVCVAGVDLETKKWIRLYPIPFRDLDNDKKFKKYSIIEVDVTKASKDKRPESYKIYIDSIKIEREINTSNNWKERKEIILPTISESLCEIIPKAKKNIISLAVLKPRGPKFYYCRAKEDRNLLKKQSYYAQGSLLDKEKEPIDKIPYEFRCKFKCANKYDCKGHDLMIIDWEIFQAFRKWKRKYENEQKVLDAIIQKWQNVLCAEDRDYYFYVGNMQRFKENFMVLGILYPKK